MKLFLSLRDFLKSLTCCQSSCMNQTQNIENNIKQELDDIRNEIQELIHIMNLLLTRRSENSLVRSEAS